MTDRKKGFKSDDEANAATGSSVNEGPHKTDDEANAEQGSSIEVEETTTETRRVRGVDDEQDRTDGD